MTIDDIIQHFQKEWKTIRKAPVSCVVIFVVCFSVSCYLIFNLKQQEINNLNTQIESLKQNEKTQNDLITEYRQRLHLTGRVSSKYEQRSDDKGSLFPGKRPPIDEILLLDNPTDMIIELNNGISDKINRTGFDSLSHAEKCLHYVYWLETEVNNGGFEQYFFNSSGDYANDTPSALEEIGAHHTAQIVREAISIFPGGPTSRDRDERSKMHELMTDEISRKLNELDLKFFEYKDPLEDLQVSYLKNKQDEIDI